MFGNIGKAVGLVTLLTIVGPALAQNGLLTQQSPDQWRTSKLVGVMIYGPDNTSVGKISDLLTGKDGKIEYVVIGIGGILGIGEKDVALPYDQVKFSDQPITPPPGTTTPAMQNNSMASGSTAGGTTAAGTNMGAGLGTPPGPAATDATVKAARSTSYPDHGTVSMTADQLKNNPTFQFAK